MARGGVGKGGNGGAEAVRTSGALAALAGIGTGVIAFIDNGDAGVDLENGDTGVLLENGDVVVASTGDGAEMDNGVRGNVVVGEEGVTEPAVLGLARIFT